MKNLLYLQKNWDYCSIDNRITDLRISQSSFNKLIVPKNVIDSPYVIYNTYELLDLGVVYSAIPPLETNVRFKDHLVIEIYKSLNNLVSWKEYVELDNFLIKNELTPYSEKKSVLDRKNPARYFYSDEGCYFIYTSTSEPEEFREKNKTIIYLERLMAAVGMNPSICYPVDLHLGNIYVAEYIDCRNSTSSFERFFFNIFYDDLVNWIPLEHIAVFIWITRKRKVIDHILAERNIRTEDIEQTDLPDEIKKKALDKITKRKIKKII